MHPWCSVDKCWQTSGKSLAKRKRCWGNKNFVIFCSYILIGNSSHFLPMHFYSTAPCCITCSCQPLVHTHYCSLLHVVVVCFSSFVFDVYSTTTSSSSSCCPVLSGVGTLWHGVVVLLLVSWRPTWFQDRMIFQPRRKLPIILPHPLVPLFRNSYGIN